MALPVLAVYTVSYSGVVMRQKVSLQFGAILALVIYALLVILIVRFVLHNFLFSLILALTIQVILYGVWLLFSGTGKRLFLGTVTIAVGLVAITFELLFFIKNISSATTLFIVIALIASYILLLNNLREKYWADKRLAGTRSQNPIHFKQPYLIMNPKSGNGRALKAHIDTLARERGIEVYVTKKGDNIEELSRKAAKNGADVLGVSGGDGTIGAVAKVAIEQNLPMVVLPGGTRCHFARDLGLDPERIVDSLEGFNGVERKIDAAKINDRIFLNNASFGVYADIVDHDEYRENKVATTRKVLQELTNDKKKSYDLRFKDNNGKPHKKAVQLFLGLNPYEVLNLLELGHREKLDTGKLQITALSKLDDNTIRGLTGVFTFKRSLKSSPNITQWTGKELTIQSGSKKLTAGVDGERESYKTPVKVEIMPKALTLMVPAEGSRPRQKSPFSGKVLGRLWSSASGK